jgi:hypothetical protein
MHTIHMPILSLIWQVPGSDEDRILLPAGSDQRLIDQFHPSMKYLLQS